MCQTMDNIEYNVTVINQAQSQTVRELRDKERERETVDKFGAPNLVPTQLKERRMWGHRQVSSAHTERSITTVAQRYDV